MPAPRPSLLLTRRRAKAAFNDFYEAMLPQMKADKPGLRLMVRPLPTSSPASGLHLLPLQSLICMTAPPSLLQQYKSMIFEKWSKSPLNPRNAQPQK